MSVIDFIEGQTDCREHTPAKVDAVEDYNSGYSYEYHTQQARDHFTSGGNHEQNSMGNSVSH